LIDLKVVFDLKVFFMILEDFIGFEGFLMVLEVFLCFFVDLAVVS